MERHAAVGRTPQPQRGPETIVLPVCPGASPSPAPPVRIFVGTEPAQHRAERVLLWSIEQVRDPGRVYEIHLMKGLPGFSTLFWNTAFTNYRFAVPHFAGGAGRAIYNDVDQIYLADPAELFDMDLGRHAYLALTERETSVMLLDCERMARIWTLAAAQRRRKYGLIRSALSTPGAFGRLPPEWNSRDEEYAPDASKLLHYTTIHKQPWRPFPERFVYQPNPHEKLWLDLERDADAAGYQVYGPDHPSARFAGVGSRVRARTRDLDEALGKLVSGTRARSLLELGAAPHDTAPAGECVVERASLDAILAKGGEPAPRDGVACLRGLEDVPVADAPWIVDQLFRNARRFVFAALRCAARPATRRWVHSPQGSVDQPEWWVRLFEAAARRHPDVRWELALSRTGRFEGRELVFRSGGPFLGEGPPRVWVLTDFKPGHTTQSIGLAEELGWPTRRIDLQFSPVAELPNALLGASRLGLTPACARSLAPPWPDLVVAAGRRTAPVASWIRDQARGRTRTVQLGRMGVFRLNRFDLAVAPIHARLFPDPRHIQTLTPITRVRPELLEKAAVDWKHLFELGPSPRIALLVGGNDPGHVFTPAAARELGERMARMAREAGGCVYVTTSRRTPTACADALEAALGDVAVHVHRWTADDDPLGNPYPGYLALADAIVTTGESASMIAEACATGKPVSIYPLPRVARGPRGWAVRWLQSVADAVDARAGARPTNRRGFERPQRGLELLCAELISRGLIRPNQDVRLLHEALVARGVASRFDGSFPAPPAAPYCERTRVAEQIRALLGYAVPAAPRDD